MGKLINKSIIQIKLTVIPPWTIFFLVSIIFQNLYYSNHHHTEICDNSRDDDSDGLTDLNDPDCNCSIIKPVSFIPNPSFEDKECCPSNRSQLNCATTWIQASEPTTDYLNTCGWMGWPEFPVPLPIPNGNGLVGFRDGRAMQGGTYEGSWKEYAGACLLQPLKKGEKYRIEFNLGFVDDLRSPPINITFFGVSSCAKLPFGAGNVRLGCPANGPDWVRLGSVYLSGQNQNTWVQSFIEVSPLTDINAIAIGPDCPDINNPVSTYYYFDNLVLADLESFKFKITESTHPCNTKFTLEVPERDGVKYQWYKEGVALNGETKKSLSKMYGEGDYQARVEDSNGNCKLTEKYQFKIPKFNYVSPKNICKGSEYKFAGNPLKVSGIYTHTFKDKNDCDSIVNLNLKVIGESYDTIGVKIFEGDYFEIGKSRLRTEGEHVVLLKSSIGCDSFVLVNLTHYKVHFPNIFSPNQDGINDIFRLTNNDEEITEYEITIFDRWGSVISKEKEWDGQNSKGDIIPGVYIYNADLKSKFGSGKTYRGSVTLIK
jgi:gliding motility-associated-like protein